MGLTLDTGALIDVERAMVARSTSRMAAVWEMAVEEGTVITVPALVVAEFWHDQRGPASKILRRVTIEPVDAAMARALGRARARLGHRTGPSLVDASVVLSAHRRSDVVFTGDVDDLEHVRDTLGLRVRIESVSSQSPPRR